jgi:flagellar protein FlaG
MIQPGRRRSRRPGETKERIVQIRAVDPVTPSPDAAEGVVVASDRPAVAPAAAAQQPSRDAVESAVQAANAALEAQDQSLQFIIDPDTRSVVVRLVDTRNNEVLRQVPSEEMLAIAKAIDRMELPLLRTRV